MASELCVHRILPDDSIAYWQVFLFLARTAASYREYQSHSLEPFVARRMVEVFCSVILVLSWGVEVRSKSELECRAREAAASVRARHRRLVHSVSAEG